MIIDSILSIAFLLSCRKCILYLKQLGILRNKLATISAVSVAQALKKIAELPKGRKVFMVIRGLVRLKNKIKGENSIYSLFQHADIKATKLSEYLRRGSWNDLSSKSFWRQPFSLKKLIFQLQDMTEEAKLQIRGVSKASMTGALTQVFKSTQKRSKPSTLIGRWFVQFYNYIATRFPFALVLNPISLGNEIVLHSVQDGQYVLVMGDFEKTQQGQVFCAFPKYITKQASYIESKLKKKYNRVCLVTCLLLLLLGITGVNVLKELWQKFKRWRAKFMVEEEYNEEDRSQNQGQNCNCALCYVNVRNIIFKPCRHYAVCKPCYQQLPSTSACPFCKKPIDGIIEVIKVK